MKNQKGFTLIELLVVIAVIGILAGVIVASLNSARSKGRDARRMRDIQEFRNAIEMYISANGVAPDLGSPSCVDPVSYDNGSCYANETGNNWDTLQSQLAPYLATLPEDPCGENCYGNGTKYRGFFAYHYIAPGGLSYLEDMFGSGTNTSTSYRIYAQNLETRSASFGFGMGSF